MANLKLKDRIESYQDSSDYRLLSKLPTVISVNGRGFSKVTSLLDKPYDPQFTECMIKTALKLSTEIEGTVFCYYYGDEIILITRNDQTLDTSPWFDNKLQKIVSISSSLSTLYFNKYSSAMGLNLISDSLFSSQVFTVPNIIEAINTIICKQQHNFYLSVHFACFYELLKKYDKNNIKEMLAGLSIDEKIDILFQESNINFNNYPQVYRRGAACYKTPKVVDGVLKNKWVINTDLPIFTKDQSFLNNIFKNGNDIVRKENL
jgi:tRNA(His) 5'-end guanylyltransferase